MAVVWLLTTTEIGWSQSGDIQGQTDSDAAISNSPMRDSHMRFGYAGYDWYHEKTLQAGEAYNYTSLFTLPTLRYVLPQGTCSHARRSATHDLAWAAAGWPEANTYPGCTSSDCDINLSLAWLPIRNIGTLGRRHVNRITSRNVSHTGRTNPCWLNHRAHAE
ncbi:hypothetical protein F5X97DRAFT_294501 [Nemania serpens]|nr:hypothetical protein F5X97DRAFT_294501 [Nemania serpens]